MLLPAIPAAVSGIVSLIFQMHMVTGPFLTCILGGGGQDPPSPRVGPPTQPFWPP